MGVFTELGEGKEVTLRQGKVRYRDRGSGLPIVFVHADYVNGDLWRKVVPELATSFRCLTPDWPLGAHEVPMDANADLSPPGVAGLIAEFITALSLQQVTLVGNNTGGVYCQLLVTRAPERIGRLVLTDCHAYNNFPARSKRFPIWVLAHVPGALFVTARALHRWRRVLHGHPLVFGLDNKKPVEARALDSYFRPAATNAGVRRDLQKVLRGMDARYTVEAAKGFHTVDRPVLIAWAPEDKIFPLSDALKLCEAFPKARLERIEDSYASVPEDQPERLALLIATFVKETGVPAD